MSGHVAHPLVLPLPRVVRPAAQLVRYVALRELRRRWQGRGIELELPSGEVVRVGEDVDARVRIHDDGTFLRLVTRGELGAGEAYVAGEWSTPSGDELVGVVRAFLRATSARGFESPLTRIGQLASRVRHRRAANTHAGSARNVHAHYDLGNAFYRLFLDGETLGYSCGLWSAELEATAARETGSSPVLERALAESQRAKVERLCDWLALSPRDHLLEIGCGWGGMAIHAARTRGCRVTAITISRKQHALACERVAAAGLGDRISVELCDYRELTGTYDKIVSIEMLEQVGFEFLPRYFSTCARLLSPGGAFAVQSITMPDDRFESYRSQVDWMQMYVFPGTLIPSLAAIERACRETPLSLVRSDDIGPSYAPTLRAWRERFVASLPDVRALGFDEPFIRTWLLYLAFSEAAFAERTLGDHQLLFRRR